VIRRNIISGVLAPGSKLVVAALAQALKLSATPINEALAGLEQEGLVTYSPHRDYFVRTVTPEDIEETYSVREAFELLAVRNAAKNADKTVIGQLKEILQQARQSLREVATTARAPGRFRGAFEEHNDIYQAIRNRDPMRAESSMRTHLHNAKTALEHAVFEEAGIGSYVSATGASKTKPGSKRSRARDIFAQSVPKQRT
jgi:DNA-binding GntR family transcriptional regulator